MLLSAFHVVEPCVADAAKLCARIYSPEQGKLNEAMVLQRQAYEIRKKVFGDEHPLVASDLNNLALLLWNQDNESEEAARLGKQALAISEKVLGSDHPQTVNYRNDWAPS